MIKINGLDLPIKVIDEKKYINFNYFLLAHRNYSGIRGMPYEIKKLPQNTWVKEKSGKNVTYYVNGLGVLDFIQRAISMRTSQKKFLIEQLIDNQMIEKTEFMYFVRREISFLDSLSKFMGFFGYEVNHQVRCERYLIDYVIGNFAIEYDENDHLSYNNEEEKKRADFIKSKGFELIRVSDKKSDIENIAIIFKFIKEYE